ncbi:predicted porin [Alloalcanivorax xenomutans]|uniref:porin n=1 Tax=Alloalcanivorax xenomutans TaxID=1094342 RepID=UPI0006D5CEB3|nr:porin [Alloalcanivorax xenomutans]CUR46227.1 Outer membrane protein (porin) [Alloalcanivorax xenomutans]SOC20179.1 predicted porin [Alloalcanivorax xenomutans]
MKLKKQAAIVLGAAALMSAAGPVSAEAKVSFYGLLDLWAGSAGNKTTGDDTLKMDAGGMATSFLGFKASMDLTPGITGIAAAEMFFRPDNAEDGRYGGDEFFARSAYIGATGDFGTLKAGRNTAPYYLPVVFSNSLGGSFTFSPSILHSFQGGNYGPIMGDSGWSNSLAYTTPEMGGLTATLMYAFGEEEDEHGENKVGGNAVYRNGKFMATVAAHSVKQGALAVGDVSAGEYGAIPDATDQDAVMVGVAYDFDIFKLFAQYQNLATDTLNGDVDTDTYVFSFAVPAGGGSVLGSYGYSDFTGAWETERDTWSVAYSYPLAKQLDLYAVFMHDDVEIIGDADSYGVGAQFRF